MFFGRIIKATFMHHLTPTEKHTLMDNFFFFKIHIADLFQRTLGKACLKQQSFPEILLICYFRALWAWQVCLTTSKKNFMIKLLLRWISYYMQKAKFLPQIVFEILKFKKLGNLIGLEYSQLQLKNQIFHSHTVFKDSQRWCII